MLIFAYLWFCTVSEAGGINRPVNKFSNRSNISLTRIFLILHNIHMQKHFRYTSAILIVPTTLPLFPFKLKIKSLPYQSTGINSTNHEKHSSHAKKKMSNIQPANNSWKNGII